VDKLQFFNIYICCFITAACAYNIDCRYTIRFEQEMAVRLAMGLIIGRDVSSTVPSTSTSTLRTSTITRTRLLFNDDQPKGTLHLRIQ